MNNPWYNAVNGQGMAMQPQQTVPQNQTPVMGQIMQAMRNPMAFAMNAFPDVPRELWNNPPQALQYIQQSRGISQQDLQNMLAQFPIPRF